MKLGKRARAFLDVFAPVFEEYQKRLGGRIDFQDMILRAAHYAETGRYVSPFRHILVDEFQDISQSRARLVKAMKAQHPDVRVFAVGDDWQSIFRFAGVRHPSDASFRAGVWRLLRWRRLACTAPSILAAPSDRSTRLPFAARTFVLRNPAQIQKQIVPAGTATEPAIRLMTVSKGEDEAKLSEVLTEMSATETSEAKPATVLLLGRYRLRRARPAGSEATPFSAAEDQLQDHPWRPRVWRLTTSSYLTPTAGAQGFPSEIVDDPLLYLVSPEDEAFPNAEERRVMYVAMTRARHTLTILASNARPSSFVTELGKRPRIWNFDSPRS